MNSSFNIQLPQIAFEILNTIESKSEESCALSDEAILTLHSIFGVVFERATEILEKSNAVSLYTIDDNSRSTVEVKGHSNVTYKLIPNVNFCPCPAFEFQVLRSNSELTCKHVLAAKIALITKTYKQYKVTPKQYGEIISTIFLIEPTGEE